MLIRAALVSLGAIAVVSAGCHSSSHGVAGAGGSGGNAHGDAAGDVVGSGAGGGGGAATTVTDGGAGARGSGGGGGTTGAGGGSSATDASSDIVGGDCNTLLPAPGPAVTTVCAPDGGAPPTPTGGTIVPGTYTLTEVTDYGYCAPVFIGQTLALTADTLETAANTTNTGLERANSTFTVAGSNLMAIQTCPEVHAATVNTAGFSVSTAAGVTTLTLISTSAGALTTVLVFTKQ